MKTLSKSESMVMESGRRFLRTLDVVGILSCTRGQAGVVLHNMHRKGWLVRVKGGLYADPEKVRSEYSLLPVLSKKYYLSYFTALNHHGLTTQVPMTMFAASLDRRGTASLLGTDIMYIRIAGKKFFGFAETAFGEERVCVADREKALLDSLDKPQYSGGISHVVSCFRNEMDAEKLGNYALRIGNKSLIRRLGAVLGESKIRIPARLKKKMLEKASDVPYYTKMGNAAGEGRKIREWKVIWNVK